MDLLLNDEQLKLVVHNVANDKDGLKLLGHLLESSGYFSKGYNHNEPSINIYNKGRADFGLEIRDLLLQYAFDSYVKILRKGVQEDGK